MKKMRVESRFSRTTRLSWSFASQGPIMLFLAALARLVPRRDTPSRDELLVQSRLGYAGLTVITVVYVLVVLWQRG
jgi:hypothetical protein